MTSATKNSGLIRMALMAVAFAGLTAILIVFQPGSPRHASTIPDTEPSVTRIAPQLDSIVAASNEQPNANIDIRKPHAVGDTAESLQPASMRDLTFVAISNLRSATTRETPTPGRPGSLLHSVVQRSIATTAPTSTTPSPVVSSSVTPVLTETSTAVAVSPTSATLQFVRPELALSPTATTYFVQPGDTLVSIARQLYGDVNMTSALYILNTDIMARPDSIRPGMVLELPSR